MDGQHTNTVFVHTDRVQSSKFPGAGGHAYIS